MTKDFGKGTSLYDLITNEAWRRYPDNNDDLKGTKSLEDSRRVFYAGAEFVAAMPDRAGVTPGTLPDRRLEIYLASLAAMSLAELASHYATSIDDALDAMGIAIFKHQTRLSNAIDAIGKVRFPETWSSATASI